MGWTSEGRWLSQGPPHWTSFVGRERELAQVKDVLTRTRLVTLTGVGGSGKTRLAWQVARDLQDQYSHGVGWVELASLTDAALTPQTVASALGVKEEPGRDIVATLIESLAARHMLLVLDNCEHVAVACASLAQRLLQACPQVTLLCTSQETLRAPGETVWSVPPLHTPSPQRLPTLEALEQFDAVRLFVERAQAVLPAFALTPETAPLVVGICQRLDGIPLAIELAAARVRLLSLEQIARRLNNALSLLRGDGRGQVARHQTLRAALDWSYHLLSSQEQTLLRRLSAFAGGFTLEAAEAVCGDEALPADDILDGLTALDEKSLVVVESQQGESARYRLLETIRQYGQDRLKEPSNQAEAEAVQRRHVVYYQTFAAQAIAALASAAHVVWLRRLQAEVPNLRAALEWSLTASPTDDIGLRLVGDLWRYWHLDGSFTEGRQWLTAVLTHTQGQMTAWRARALRGAGFLAYSQGDYAAAQALYSEALAIRESLGEWAPIARLLSNLGQVAQKRGEFAKARGLFEQSLSLVRTLGDKRGIATALQNLGIVANYQGDYATARPVLEECLTLLRELGDHVSIAGLLNTLGELARIEGDYEQAQILYTQSVALNRELGHRVRLTWPLHNLGHVALHQGDLAVAAEHFQAALDLAHDQGRQEPVAACLAGLACVAARIGLVEPAARLSGAADAMLVVVGGVLGQADQAEYTRSLELVKKQVGEARFQGLRAAGQGMPLTRALAEAEQVSATARQRGTATESAPQSQAPAAPPVAVPEPATTALQIFALRLPRVLREGRELTAADGLVAKPREMLYYLLLWPPRSRAQLALDLWPDLSEKELRHSLHNTLTQLRGALGQKEWVAYERGVYSFQRRIEVAGQTLTCWFDVDQFEADIQRGHQIYRQMPGEAMTLLEEALGLYETDLLGHRAYDWATARQEDIQRQFEDAALLLGQLYLDAGRAGEAEEVYRRMIRRDPYQEAAHRGVMLALARQGQRPQALRHYEGLVQRLTDEMGMAPMPETQALAERIRRGEE